MKALRILFIVFAILLVYKLVETIDSKLKLYACNQMVEQTISWIDENIDTSEEKRFLLYCLEQTDKNLTPNGTSISFLNSCDSYPKGNHGQINMISYQAECFDLPDNGKLVLFIAEVEVHPPHLHINRTSISKFGALKYQTDIFTIEDGQLKEGAFNTLQETLAHM